MRVLAIDPGDRVGWAVADVVPSEGESRPGRPPLPGPQVLTVVDHGITSLKEFAQQMDEEVRRGDYDAVIFENFRITPKKAHTFIGSDIPTLQLIGMIRLACWQSRTKIVEQTPGDKTSARLSLTSKKPGVAEQAADINQRLAKMPKKHDDAHDGDALLHLWNWYFQTYI